MRYILESKPVLNYTFTKPSDGDFEFKHVYIQNLLLNPLNNFQYSITHHLIVLNKVTTNNEFELKIRYDFLISEIDKLDFNFFEDIIIKSAELFNKEFKSLTHGHFFSHEFLNFEIDVDASLDQIVDFLKYNLSL